MPQSLSNILIHIVFSTRNRAPLIPMEITPDLRRHLAAISHAHGCPAHETGGTEDHVHVCCSLARTQTCAKVVEEMKTCSSRWMKTRSPRGGLRLAERVRRLLDRGGQLDALRGDIQRQPEHHTRVVFAEELRDLLRQQGIAYDERHIRD
jgi:putative transposase